MSITLLGALGATPVGAVSVYDDVPWTTDTLSFQGDDLTYTSKAFWMGSCGNTAVKDNFLAGRFVIVQLSTGGVQLLTWPTTVTSPGNIVFAGGSGSGYTVQFTRYQGSVGINHLGSCNLTTTFSSSFGLANSNSPAVANKVFIAGSEANIEYPTGYEGPEPLRDFPTPPTPPTGGTDLMTPLMVFIGASLAILFLLWIRNLVVGYK